MLPGMASFTSLVSFPIWEFYFDICEWRILSVRTWTPALILHLTNPCTKRNVLCLTKPKGKIYKTKSLRHYITQRDTLTPCLFIICVDYVLRTSIDIMKVNGLKLVKERSKKYPPQTITDADHADDIALLANTPTQTESLLHSLEQTAGSIGLHVNADKTEYMCFNQREDISTLNGSSLNSWTSSPTSESASRLPKIILTRDWQKHGQLSMTDRLSVIWKSDLSDKLNRSFFQVAVVSILLYGCTM